MNTKIEVFCSYSHRDRAFLEELKVHMAPLLRQGLISIWNDTDISPGAHWEDEINKHLYSAQIILLLISPDFIASDYCYSNELRKAIHRDERREARVIPIILRPTHWKIEPLNKLHALPKDAEPITLWNNRDAAYLDVTNGLIKVVDDLRNEEKYQGGYHALNKTESVLSKSQYVFSESSQELPDEVDGIEVEQRWESSLIPASVQMRSHKPLNYNLQQKRTSSVQISFISVSRRSLGLKISFTISMLAFSYDLMIQTASSKIVNIFELAVVFIVAISFSFIIVYPFLFIIDFVKYILNKRNDNSHHISEDS